MKDTFRTVLMGKSRLKLMFFLKNIRSNSINNRNIIVLNRQGRLKHRFISEIWILNRFYDWFDGPKWIDFLGADYLSDNDYFSIIFLDQCNRLRLPGCVCFPFGEIVYLPYQLAHMGLDKEPNNWAWSKNKQVANP